MHPTVHDRILALLRDAPDRALLLDDLYHRLVRLTGTATPSPLELDRELRRAGPFILSEPTSPMRLFDRHLDPALRADYAVALREAGVETEVRVALREDMIAEPATSTSTVSLLEYSLAALRETARQDPLLLERLAAAQSEMEAIRPLLQASPTG